MAVTKEEIIELGFKHLGHYWFSNEHDTIRIRKWVGDEIDFHRWWDDNDNKLHFRGKIENIDEMKWVLERCFPNYKPPKQGITGGVEEASKEVIKPKVVRNGTVKKNK